MRLLSPLILCLLILAFVPIDLFAQTSVNLNPEGTITCELGTEQNELSTIEAAGSPNNFPSVIKALKKKLRKGKKKIAALRAKLRQVTGKKKKQNIKTKITNARLAKKQNRTSLTAVKDCQNQTLVPHSELCGNNLIEPFEDCDDGNLNENDCCASTCLFENTETDCGELPAESCGSFRCDGVGSCELTPICSDGNSCTENDFCENESCHGTPFTSPNSTGCGVGACFREVFACNNGSVNSCSPGVPSNETCDGADNDCDGATDEGNPGGGSACNSGLPGICQDGTTACESGSIACNPNNTPVAETCNRIDDDCDGALDNGLAQDSFEPNNSCGTFFSLGTLGSDQSLSEDSATLYSSGDEDFYRIRGSESDDNCGCGPLSGDEDYNMQVSLTVPASAGSYQVCSESTSCGTFSNCTTVNAGSSGSIDLFLDGECPGHDEYNVFVRVRGIGAPGFSCFPYVLQATFISGLCR